MGESEPYPDRQFPELQILLDGTQAPMENAVAAFVGSADVREAIHEAPVDPFIVSDTPPVVSLAPGAALERLERLGAVKKLGGDYLANWTAQRSVRVLVPATRRFRLTKSTGPATWRCIAFRRPFSEAPSVLI
jgi:hypothetical protein